MSVNDISSLVRWVSVAKQRMGEDNLMGFLGLYIKYAHYSPQLKELVAEISELLKEVSPAQSSIGPEHSAAIEWTDLMLHLQGILANGATAPSIPQLNEEGHYKNGH